MISDLIILLHSAIPSLPIDKGENHMSKDTKKKKSVPVGKPLPEGMIGTKEAAKRLKIEPRELRVWLRSKNGTNGGERYCWDEKGLSKLANDFKADPDKNEAASK
jgi:hypothetical protein